jgi:hypothetical protein
MGASLGYAAICLGSEALQAVKIDAQKTNQETVNFRVDIFPPSVISEAT